MFYIQTSAKSKKKKSFCSEDYSLSYSRNADKTVKIQYSFFPQQLVIVKNVVIQVNLKQYSILCIVAKCVLRDAVKFNEIQRTCLLNKSIHYHIKYCVPHLLLSNFGKFNDQFIDIGSNIAVLVLNDTFNKDRIMGCARVSYTLEINQLQILFCFFILK